MRVELNVTQRAPSGASHRHNWRRAFTSRGSGLGASCSSGFIAALLACFTTTSSAIPGPLSRTARLQKCTGSYREAAEDDAPRTAGLVPPTATSHASLQRAHSSPSSRTTVLADPTTLVIFEPHSVYPLVPEWPWASWL